MSVSIQIKKVAKSYGDVEVLKDLSLDIKPGELFTLLGPSGCGKTTLLRMVIGFNSIDKGVIEVDDQVINDIPVNKRKMGMVFQNYAVFPHMTVKENIAFGLKVHKMDKEEMERRIGEILRVVRIEEHKDKRPDQLSGGQQQRVALARALVIHPKVLLMDEPLSNLDAKLRIEMRNAIRNIQENIGITTLYVTHDQEEALAISDRIAVLNDGVIQQIGEPKEIYSRPQNLFVAQFIGTSNVLKGKIKKSTEKCFIHYLGDDYKEEMSNLISKVKDGQDVLLAIRPQDFTLTEGEEGISGIIENTVFLGLNTHYFVKVTSGEIVEVIQEDDAVLLKEGTAVKLKVNPEKINIFDAITEETLIKAGE